jgi:hypothetical protein
MIHAYMYQLKELTTLSLEKLFLDSGCHWFGLGCGERHKVQPLKILDPKLVINGLWLFVLNIS